jgi:hypothetical protein
MKKGWRTISKWLLLLLTFALSTLAAAILLELLPLLERLTFGLASVLHLNIAPSLILQPIARLTLFGIILLWVIPSAFMAGFALRARWFSCWQWGYFASIMLLVCFFWPRSQFDRELGVRWAAESAVFVLIAERLLSSRRLLRRGTAMAVQCAALVLLFAPWVSHLTFAQKLPPEPRKIWSIVPQKGIWQAMNTGSEFAATRQMVFAGDRVVIAFDSGNVPSQDNQPMSRYRVLSLDRATGEVKNQMDFIGHWGSMPYLFATTEGRVILANGTLQLLKPNLEPTGISFAPNRGRVNSISPDGTTLAWETSPGTTLLDATNFKPLVTLPVSVPTSVSRQAMLNDNMSWPKAYPRDHAFITRTDAQGSKLIFHGECGGRPQFLASARILSDGCGSIRIFDNAGTVVATRRDTEDAYSFAGVNQSGTRFALQASEAIGDPASLIYEQFFIYDASSAVPLASISTRDMPERQSWTAFSPNGQFFAVGNPNQLNLYELPSAR